MPDLKRVQRRQRVIELRCLGYKIPMIVKTLKDEGFVVGATEITVRRDLQSTQTQEYVEELKRRQYVDIALSNDPSLRMKYRDKILDKIMPRKIEQKTETKGEMKIDIPELEGLSGDAISAVVENFMEEEARKLRQRNPEPI